MVAPFVFVQQLRDMAMKYWMVGPLCACVALIVLLALVCGPQKFRRKFPINMGLLFCFTLYEAVAIAFTTGAGKYSPLTVAIAFGATIVIVGLITLFAFQTKYDFTSMGGVLMICFGVCYVISIVWAIVAYFVAMDKMTYNIIELVIATGILLLFVGFLIYDTQLLIGGTHKYALSPEDYVMGALAIYIDIINIFLQLLRIIRSAQNLAQ